MSDAAKSGGTPAPEVTIESAIDHAKRAFALRKYEQAVDHYATALELMTQKYGDDAPEMADMYLSYGKALLENAIAQSSVLGKEQAEDGLAKDEQDDHAKSGKILSFSGDAEEEDDVSGEDVAVDLFAEAARAVEEAGGGDDGEDGEGEDEDAEPEDDFNASWEVLDLARAIYEKQMDEDDEVRLKLADTYIALGDVSLETEKFEQAITDYSASLKLKADLLPLSSRQIAEVHYKLSMVLDLTSGRLGDAIMHAQRALESVEARLAELQAGLDGSLQPVEAAKPDVKGKGRARPRLVTDDLVQNMSKSQIEAEVKELKGLKEDLALKVDELKTSPNQEQGGSAPELAARALDRELKSSSSAQLPVNDLTGMVKKKKKAVPEANGAEKRKAEDDGTHSPPEKKAKLEEASSS
ncbi:hypothetical protein FA95DRAFT_1542504 [Auriscalpium vulgare]|uniref:Uncharacterized protein n=1 Tax=Auriscalpium vulgare TaxID=40419 RepID=A0ACB8RQP8_9AGAM|nr:hypothetical protein FA95DRAFT_1542504 [Auriscalpium vulgare]